MLPLSDCIRNKRPCQSEALDREKADILNFRTWLAAAPAAFDVTVVLHNLVTETVRTADVKRFECADRAFNALPAALGELPRARAPGAPLPEGLSLPGLGAHRLVKC